MIFLRYFVFVILLLLLVVGVSGVGVDNQLYSISCEPNVSTLQSNGFNVVCEFVNKHGLSKNVDLSYCFEYPLGRVGVSERGWDDGSGVFNPAGVELPNSYGLNRSNVSWVWKSHNVSERVMSGVGVNNRCWYVNRDIGSSNSFLFNYVPTNFSSDKFDVGIVNPMTQGVLLLLDPFFNSTLYEVGTERSSVYQWRNGTVVNVDVNRSSVVLNPYNVSVAENGQPFLLIEADLLNRSAVEEDGCSLVSFNSSNHYLYCDGVNGSVIRGKMYESLFRNDSSTVIEGFENISAIRTSVSSDVGKNAFYMSMSNSAGVTWTYTGTFTDNTSNFNVSLWSYLYCANSGGSPYIHETYGLSGFSVDNPTDVQLDSHSTSSGYSRLESPSGSVLDTAGGTDCSPTASGNAVILASGDVTFALTGVGATGTNINYSGFGVPSLSALNNGSGVVRSNNISLSSYVKAFRLNASGVGDVKINLSFNGSDDWMYSLGLNNNSFIYFNPIDTGNDVLRYVVDLNGSDAVLFNFSLTLYNYSENVPVINDLNVSSLSVLTTGSVTFNANVSSDTFIESDSCVIELFKSDYISPLHNITTNSLSGDVVSRVLSMSVYSSGVLEWRKAFCSDGLDTTTINSSVGVNITISVPAGSPGGGGGGGGGGDIIVINPPSDNGSLFSFFSNRGGVDNSVLFYPGQTRRFGLVVVSDVSESQSLRVSCVGDLCGKNVVLSTSKFELLADDSETFFIDVSVPESSSFGDSFVFKLQVSDGKGFVREVGYDVGVSRVANFFSKFDLLTGEGEPGFLFRVGGVAVPKVLLYFVLTFLGVAGFYGMYSKKDGKVFWTGVFGLGMFMFLVVLI